MSEYVQRNIVLVRCEQKEGGSTPQILAVRL